MDHGLTFSIRLKKKPPVLLRKTENSEEVQINDSNQVKNFTCQSIKI